MRQIKRVEEMKEIKVAGKLECKFSSPLQRHMENIQNKLNDLGDAVQAARNDGYTIKVDISKLGQED